MSEEEEKEQWLTTHEVAAYLSKKLGKEVTWKDVVDMVHRGELHPIEVDADGEEKPQ